MVLLVAGIVLIAASLRPAITVVGPVVDQIQLDTGISATAAGLITTVPVLAFGAISVLAPALGRRLGIEAALLASVLVLTGGIAVRAIPGIAPLFIGTAVLGIGIAVANVLLPALVKRDFPARLGLLTALYSSVLGGSAAIASGVAVPLADGTSLGWRGALAIWALPAVAAAVIWIPQLGRAGSRGEMAEPVARPREAWSSRVAWQVTLFFGFQSLGYYVTIAWLPAILVDAGLAEGQAGLMLFVTQVAGVVSMLVFPQVAVLAANQRRLVGLMCGLVIAGVAGLLGAGATAVEVWVVLLGLGQGAGLALGLMFFVLRTRDQHQAAELSGMAQSVGYTLAAAGPIAAGLIHDATGAWTLVLVLLALAAALQWIAGLGAGRAVVVGRPVTPGSELDQNSAQ